VHSSSLVASVKTPTVGSTDCSSLRYRHKISRRQCHVCPHPKFQPISKELATWTHLHLPQHPRRGIGVFLLEADDSLVKVNWIRTLSASLECDGQIQRNAASTTPTVLMPRITCLSGTRSQRHLPRVIDRYQILWGLEVGHKVHRSAFQQKLGPGSPKCCFR
jgi:hypothetical protein